MAEELVVPTVIRNLDLETVRKRLVKKKGWTSAHAERMIEEYRECLSLFYFYPGEELVPPSQDLDDVWHEHILDTRGYSEDCQLHFLRELFRLFRQVPREPGTSGGGSRRPTSWRSFGKRMPVLATATSEHFCGGKDSTRPA